MDFLTGQKLVKQRQFGKALNIFLDLLRKGSKELGVYFYLGRIYSESGDYKKSIFYYEKCLKIDPNSINVLFNLAVVNHNIGDINSSKKIYQKLINLNNNDISSYFGLYTLDPSFISEKYYKNLMILLNDSKLSKYEKSLINFILSKKEKKKKNYTNEIKYLEKYHSLFFESNLQYYKQSEFYYKKIINKFFNKIKFDNLSVKNYREFEPLFIIGLPRSGSTLIESILTSGITEIKSYGESNYINASILEQIGPIIYNQNFILEDFEFKINLNNMRSSILNKYNQFGANDDEKVFRFIDKSLENFYNIEIILKIFPKAKFLHTYRDSKDAVISIYQSMLSELSWTYSIESILDYIENYRNIINYFKKKYPENIMDIDLKNLTENSEKTSKKIFDFCKLNWSKKVLDYYKRDNLFTKTISSTQIRKKIGINNQVKYNNYYYLLNDLQRKYKWLS